MTISMYDVSIAGMSRMLKNLDSIVTKAEAYARENDIDPSVLLRARLFPDMRDFVFQIQVTTDMAKSCAARLTGKDVPRWDDDEETFEDIHARIGKALDYLSGFRPEQFEGSENRRIELKLRTRTLDFDGKQYVTGFVIPNFYFHMTTAYNLLRHNGLAIGKVDFLGG